MLIRGLAVVRLTLLVQAVLAVSCAGAAAARSRVSRSAEETLPRATKAAFERLPGVERPRDGELAARLEAAAERLLSEGEARTEHVDEAGRPRFVNRLVLSDSPYLQQHAFNPVDWHSWGEEAFALAREQEKPIFLSIGYATCHWCHVMERESFDDLEIARLLNERFVCIKVDREQRPDVDEVYMTAVQLMTSRGGGWPLSSFLTPDGRPFHGGSYFPPNEFAKVLDRVWERWNDQRDRVEQAAAQVHLMVSSATGASGEAAQIAEETLERARDVLLAHVDRQHGGFGAAPKFPQEPILLFLAQRALRTGDRGAEEAVSGALGAMARGGIYDQVGGGFHRYATDRAWRIPHFEKMLYGQALLARAYTAGWRLSGRDLFRRVALETLRAAERDLGAPGGGFYSATDADSLDERGELVEGAYFTWTLDELAAAAGPDDAELAERIFGATARGNLEGRNVLARPRTFAEEAAALGISTEAFLERVDELRARLLERRSERPPPLRDEKVLTAWNGMMVTALAEAGSSFGDSEPIEAARRTAELLWTRHRRPDGRLWRQSVDGVASGEGLLEDYAFLAEGLLALDDASGGEGPWLERARALAETVIERFVDQESGGFFVNDASAAPLLIARPMSIADGAIPAGGSVAVGVLAALARRTGDLEAARVAERALAALAQPIERRPTAFPSLLAGLDLLRHGRAGRIEQAGGGALRAELRPTPGSSPPAGGRLPFELVLRLQDGWHVNADDPLAPDLTPTRLHVASAGERSAGWVLDDVRYPEGQRVELGFREGEMAVYSGTVELSAVLERVGEGDPPLVAPVELDVQICNDRLCLQPETLRFELVPAALRSDVP